MVGSNFFTASAKRNSLFSHGGRGIVAIWTRSVRRAPAASRHQARTPVTATVEAVGFIRALIVLHRTFGSRGLRERLHTFVRFVTCPFLRVAEHVPRGAALLEIGAGHGVFAALA